MMIENKKNKLYLGCTALLMVSVSGWLSAQESNPTASQANQSNQSQQTPIQIGDGGPLYKIQVVGRDLPAINYFHRKGATKIGFQGTTLLPTAKGTAKVESRLGRTAIDIDVEGLTPANGFGPEYLTYVLWAITPEGRAQNLGEVLPAGTKNTIHVTTALQS